MLYNKYLHNIYLLLLVVLTLSLFKPVALQAQQPNAKPVDAKSTQLTDSQKIALQKKDTTKNVVKKNPNAIDAEISYSSTDSMVLYGNGTGFLHGKGDVKYKNINLQSDYIRVKMDSSLVYARGTTDSLGVVNGSPVFSEGGNEPYSAKELTYNLRTRKGYIRQAVTQQGEGYILSDRTKKTEKDELCMAGGKYTTCDDHDHPHFFLSLSKAKVKPGSYIATGPAHLVLLDVPLPIAIPFGYFPFNTQYSSGIEMPSFETDFTYGYGLTRGGYYFALSDYADLDIRGDIYTKGTWGVNINSNYLKRYKYNGNVSVTYRETVSGEPDMPDYSKMKDFRVQWSHSQNPKVNPFRTLSASVNFSTSGYNRNDVNTYYTTAMADNTKGSSISFSQRFPNNPFSFTGSMQVNQRAKDTTISLTLPNLSIAMSRIMPFKRKNAIGNERWYEKISLSYSGSLSNSITTKEYKLMHSSLAKDWKNGMSHSIPISATFNVLKYISLSLNANYNERWSLNSVKKSWEWDEDKKQGHEVVETLYGFKRNYNFNTGLSANTTIYGFYTPIKALFGDKIQAIRHVITPQIGLGYNPDFADPMWGFYGSYTRKMVDPQNPNNIITDYVRYSKFDGTMYGGPGPGRSGSINFSVKNNLEMKVKNLKDTVNENATKIVSLIDNFTINGSYNMIADSMKWSNFTTSLGVKWKWFTYSFNLSFDPYMWGLSRNGQPVRVNKLRWNYGRFPRFQGISVPISYTFSNETFKRKDKKNKKNNSNGQDDDPNRKKNNLGNENINDVLRDRAQEDDDSQNKNKREKDADGYEKVEVPWSLSLSYSLSYGDDMRTGGFDFNKMEYKRRISGSVLNINGNIKLTPGWQLNATSGYDFEAKKFTYTVFNFTRNLHCWTLTGSFVPIGPYKTFTFRIGVNSSMLQDLKYEKQGNRGGSPTIWY